MEPLRHLRPPLPDARALRTTEELAVRGAHSHRLPLWLSRFGLYDRLDFPDSKTGLGTTGPRTALQPPFRISLHFRTCLRMYGYGRNPKPNRRTLPRCGARRAPAWSASPTHSHARTGHSLSLSAARKVNVYLVGEVSTVWALNPQRLNGTVVELDDHS